MEAVLAVGLGIWVMVSGIICYVYMGRDEDREKM